MLFITGKSSTNIYFGVLIISETSPYTASSNNIYYSTSLDTYGIRGAYITS